jgi:hypothetical protein
MLLSISSCYLQTVNLDKNAGLQSVTNILHPQHGSHLGVAMKRFAICNILLNSL